jgi:protein tyrosine phosphatase
LEKQLGGVDLELGYDYINANWIKGRFIATQAPPNFNRIHSAVADFWLMATQTKATKIIMLTPFNEPSGQKAEKYFPENEGQSETFYSYQASELHAALKESRDPTNPRLAVKITCIESSEIHLGQTQKRKFLLELSSPRHAKKLVTQTIDHYHYLDWPDGSVPLGVDTVLELAKIADGDPKGPVIVHCSAGHGRTGTFITICLATQTHLDNTNVITEHILNAFRQVRASRHYSISSIYQMMFALHAYTTWLMDHHKGEIVNIQQINTNISSIVAPKVLRCMHCFNCVATTRCSHPKITGDRGDLAFCSQSCSDAFCASVG